MNSNLEKEDLEFASMLNSVSKQLGVATHSPKLNASSGSTPNNSSTTTTTTTTSTSIPSLNDIDGNEKPIITDEDYAAELQSQFNRELAQQNNNEAILNQTIVDIVANNEQEGDSIYTRDQFDLPNVIAPSSEYTRFFHLKRTATLIKGGAAFFLIYSIMSYFYDAWWLIFSFGFVFNPIGMYAAHYLQRRLFLIYIMYVGVDVVFRICYVFSHVRVLGGFGTLMSLILYMIEGYFGYFCFNFYKKMPINGRETFREFFLNDQGLFSFN